MKIIGIIPARYNSTRFPGKPLVEIDGMSMIMRVYTQARKVNSFNKIIVATDDQRIYDHVLQAGGEVMMTSTEHISGTDRCGEVISKIKEDFDVVINIQGDEPFIQPEQLNLLISAFNDPKTEIATLIKTIHQEQEIQNPNLVKVVKSLNNNALYFSRSVIPFPRNPFLEYFKHIGIYGYRTTILRKLITLSPTQLEKAESLEQLRWLENGFSIKTVVTEIETAGIDTPEDLTRVLQQMK